MQGIETITYKSTAKTNTSNESSFVQKIDILKEKCQLKDHMIMLLANELKMAYGKCKWNGKLHFKTKIYDDLHDFNRHTLYQYLQGERVPTLFSIQVCK